MAASAQPRLSESPPPQLDRLFEYCLLGLVLVGFVAVLLPGGIDGYTATIVGGVILLRGLRVAGRLRFVIRRGAAAVVAFLLVAFYPVDAVWLSGDFMQASVRLLLLFAALNLLIANRPRDYFYVSLLAFLELLTASMFLAGLTYLAVLAVFLALAATAYMTNELRKGWQDAPRVVAPADVRLGLPRRILRVGGGLSAGVLLAASVLFLALPRPQASAGGRFDDPTTVGFSPEINLDKTGALSEDPTPVMRVESLDDAPLTGQYWRAVTLFHFDGMRWTAPGVRSRPLNGTDGGVWPGHGRRSGEGLRLRYRVRLEPLPTDALFLAGLPEQIRGSFSGLHVSDVDTIQVAELQPGPLIYEATAWLPDRRTLQPTDVIELFSERFQRRYLQLPDYDERIAELAKEIAAEAESPLRKAEAMEAYFRTQFGYSLDLPAQRRADPLAHFLFERREGHCEYFATSMALMLRIEGIPSRIVNGFAGGVRNPLSGGYLLRSNDAHSWVEAYIPGYGWLQFDPTPPTPPSALGPWVADVQGWWETAQATWAEWVVGYDALRQVELAKSFRDAFREAVLTVLGAIDAFSQAVAAASGVAWMADWVGYAFWLLPLLLLAAVWRSRTWWAHLRRRRRLSSGRGEASDAQALYERALQILERRGFKRAESQTAEEFESSVQDRPTRDLVARITAAYNAARFGSDSAAGRGLPDLVQALERLR